MNGSKLSAALCISLLASSAVLAEDLMEIYTKAQRNDPAIREAEANMLANLERKPQALANLLPQVDLSAGWNYGKSDGRQAFGRAGGAAGSTPRLDFEGDTDTRNWTVDLRQTLFDTDAWFRLKKSDKEVAQARADYEVAQQDLVVRVAETYFDVLAAQDTLASERATKEAIARQLEQAERRFEVGLIAITDVKESQAAYDDAIALEIAARRALANTKEGLREVTGEYPQTLATPGDEFPLIPPNPQVEQDWVDIALQKNASLEAARLGTEISRDNIKIARSGHAPTINLTASYGKRRLDGDSTTFDVPQPIPPSPLDVPSENFSDTRNRSVGIQFSLPIFSGGGTSSAVQEQVYLHRASRENYEKSARNTERETRDAYLGVIAEIARVRALARSVESNQTALAATEAGYDVGTRTTVDVLNARESLFRAETQYARSKYDYLLNVMKLKLAAGTLNASDVVEINNWLVVSEQLEQIPGRGGEPDAELEESSVPTRPDAQSDQS
jgi:outer membrane protein